MNLCKYWLCFLLGLLLASGCSRAPAPNRDGEQLEPEVENYLESAYQILAQNTDHAACRNASAQLNSHLDRHPEDRPQPLTEKERTALIEAFGLTASELAEISNAAFTPLDAHYMESCFLLRDAARFLSYGCRSPLDQAQAAFDWTIRQVRLVETPQVVPPSFVLRRGAGSSFERGLVFLGLLNQLEIDGCLFDVSRQPNARRRWLVTALIDQKLYLFDPLMGLPLPGTQDNPATFSELVQQPKRLDVLNIDPKFPYDVTVADVAKGTLHAFVSLSALAPRMAFAQRALQQKNRVVLAAKWQETASRFRQWAEAHRVAFRIWKRTEGAASPVSILREFLPSSEGGADVQEHLVSMHAFPGFDGGISPLQFKMYRKDIYEHQMVNWQYLPEAMRARSANSELGSRCRQLYLGLMTRYLAEPRNLLLRGRLEEASRVLVGKRDEIRQARLTEQQRKQIAQLLDHLQQAELAMIRVKDATAARLARQQFESGWVEGVKYLTALAVESAAPALEAQTVYLLALCKHEQAVALSRHSAAQGRNPLDLPNVVESWRSAADWWENFANHFGASPEVRKWQAHALAALGNRQRAADLIRDRNGPIHPIEMTGRLLLARRWLRKLDGG
ncbi:MAG: hypothetical protein KatS3mg105_3252 [Gemmatales bacterium]|nr:MAG: hypothetical protein KatS3mg105_3252 [Gemmatales bacterium]